MAKTSGGVRTYKSSSSTYRRRQEEISTMRASGKYSSVEMSKGSGYVAIEKSTSRHKPEELEAARILADKGYKVTLKNEAGLGHKIKTPDGYLFSASFEQRTPKGNTDINIRSSLYHVRDKKADVPILYMKGSGHTRQSVENGIRAFESASKYRFKQIIVVTEDGRIHRHKHNK
ncbi:MAG: hypothetical protein EGQ20_20015 [Bacteroides oleiciplenus]|nr:hypothetical protein [Bacteroides oleiciplenus]